MDMLTPLMARLRDSSEADVRAISEATEIPAPTILKIKYGQTDNPRIKTVQRLYAHLFETPMVHTDCSANRVSSPLSDMKQ